jgi:broad specificity phosphatase PhoE
LVRHASTEWNGSGRFQGRTDLSLDEVGRAEAARLADELRGRTFDGIWSSPLLRAVETARIAIGEPVVDERLAEFDFGRLEGKTWTECTPEMQADLLAFDDFCAPEGESVAQLRARIDSFLAELPPGDHIVFTHGGVIHALLRRTGADRMLPPATIVEWDLQKR